MPRQVINTFAFLDSEDGSSVTYEGPYNFERDGGDFEVLIPADRDDYAGIHEETATNLAERVGDFGIALASGKIVATGRIEAAEVVEGDLTIRVDDGNRLGPEDVDAPV